MIRVLYAEDDANVAAVVRSFFEHFGTDCQLRVVGTGREFLENMAQGGVDVALLDLMLPDTNGLEILGELALRHDPTPVIMFSGHGQNDLAVRALRAGAVDCVDKSSAQFQQVIEIVRHAYAKYSASRRTLPTSPSAAAHVTPLSRILLIEGSAALNNQIAHHLRDSAPHLQIIQATEIGSLESELRPEAAIGAAIIGPNPAHARPLEILRLVRSQAPSVPCVVISNLNDGEAAIAAFKLGAQDYLLQKDGYLTELVFSLGNIVSRAEIQKQNLHLARELENLNRSLEAQVTARTAELRALSARLLKIQEDERRAIARELHDQVGQLITGLKFQLEAARGHANEAGREKLGDAIQTTNELVAHVRELTQLYRPRILDDLGLQPALEWHFKQFERQTGIAISADFNLPPTRLHNALETVVFRVTQEALTNVARHSGSKTAGVSITTDKNLLILEITDRGRGFDLASTLARRDSVGLSGLRERIELAGGRLTIFSQPGQGTRVEAELPLSEAPVFPA